MDRYGQEHTHNGSPLTDAAFQALPVAARAAFASAGLRKKCPTCSRCYPVEYGRAKVIAVVGATGSSKSHYLAALIHALRQPGLFDRIGLQLKALSTEDFKRFNDEFVEPLYRYGRELRLTATEEVLGPFLFEITNTMAPSKPPLVIALLDTGGEAQVDPVLRFRYASYLSQAMGIVFLLDPLRMPTVARALGGGEAAGLDDPHLISQREMPMINREVISVVRGDLRDADVTDRLLDIPYAAVVSKADLIPEAERFLNVNASASRRFELSGIDTETSEVIEYLYSVDESAVVANVLNSYFYFSFHFAAPTNCPSRLGSDGARFFERVPEPRRVIEPLLTILYRRGFLTEAQCAGTVSY
ncbi:MAG: hypothetical protein AB7O92_04255 [Acidimicrobiia bacterium]